MIWKTNSNCPSLYLAFRYMVDSKFHQLEEKPVSSSEEMRIELSNIIHDLPDLKKVGLFLSGGIDSGILAKFLPENTHAFTINFKASTDVDEGSRAKPYVVKNNLIHHIVTVTWEDYVMYEAILMKNKGAPLHPLEVALYKAALAAKEEGLDTIITGTGADSNFGGMDKLLSRGWTLDEFVDRYTFVNPASVLKNPHDTRKIYDPYQNGASVDCIKFLKEIHCVEQQRAFCNAINSAGLSFVSPFTKMRPRNSLDIKRIRSGEPKYLVSTLFKELYPDIIPPVKIPFVRPMKEWLVNGFKLKSNIFLGDLIINRFLGEQKYLLRCLDRFMDLLDHGELN